MWTAVDDDDNAEEFREASGRSSSDNCCCCCWSSSSSPRRLLGQFDRKTTAAMGSSDLRRAGVPDDAKRFSRNSGRWQRGQQRLQEQENLLKCYNDNCENSAV